VCGFHNAIFIVNVNIIALIIIVMKIEVFCDAKILRMKAVLCFEMSGIICSVTV
jgi:hypothetical protein